MPKIFQKNSDCLLKKKNTMKCDLSSIGVMPLKDFRTFDALSGKQNFQLSPRSGNTMMGIGHLFPATFKAYSHQRRINSSTNWANNLVWIRPQKPIFWFLNKLDTPIGNSALVQFVDEFINSFLVWIGLYSFAERDSRGDVSQKQRIETQNLFCHSYLHFIERTMEKYKLCRIFMVLTRALDFHGNRRSQ